MTEVSSTTEAVSRGAAVSAVSTVLCSALILAYQTEFLPVFYRFLAVNLSGFFSIMG
jgi:hypothetical protein